MEKAFINGEFSKNLKKAQKENEELKKQLDAATLALGKAQLMIELIKKTQIAITSWTARDKNLGHGWNRRIYRYCQ